MEVPVEATVLLDHFQDQLEVQRLLRSHGFRVKDLGGGQVRIQGLFEHLRVLRVRLEQLLASERDEGASSSSLGPRDHGPPWSRGEWTVVDGDVFRYARRLGNKELRDLLSRPDLQTRTSEDGLSTGIRFLWSRTAAGPLQTLLDDLNKSLRTQEVPLRDLDHQGRVLLRRIQENQNVSESVLVCELKDRVHLIGPSKDSWELKQRLLGKPVDQSGARGRSHGVDPRRRRSMGPAAGRGSSSSGPDPGRPPRTQSLPRTAGSRPDPGRPQSLSQSRPDPGRPQSLSQSRPDPGRPQSLSQSRPDPGRPQSLPQSRPDPGRPQSLSQSRPDPGRPQSLSQSRPDPGRPQGLPQSGDTRRAKQPGLKLKKSCSFL